MVPTASPSEDADTWAGGADQWQSPEAWDWGFRDVYAGRRMQGSHGLLS